MAEFFVFYYFNLSLLKLFLFIYKIVKLVMNFQFAHFIIEIYNFDIS